MQIETPLVRPTIGGQILDGLMAAEIESVGFQAASQFKLVFAMSTNPRFGLAYFATLGPQDVTIDISVSGSGFIEFFSGHIDNILLDVRQNSATLLGRDRVAQLIDTDVAEIFSNLTASQIANNIAAGHQLTSNVTPTSTPVGQYYKIDHARTALFQHSPFSTEWNLLVSLAKIEGFQISVTGDRLNFGPPASNQPAVISTSRFSDITFDLATSLPASVNVKSWNTRNKMVVNGAVGAGSGPTLIRPNLSSSQAQNVASNHLSYLNRQQTMLTGRMPGELTLDVGDQILITGTQSELDQPYTLCSVVRRIDGTDGFWQQIRAYAQS